MLEGRRGHGLAVVEGELWAVGSKGEDTFPTSVFRSCERLDQVTNAWVRGPDMSTDRSNFGVATFNGELWVLGGLTSRTRLRSCERIDTVTGTWVPGPDMFVARVNHRVAVFDGELWAVGGHDRTSATCERLDTASNRWVPGPAMALACCCWFGLAVFRGQLWAVAEFESLSSCEYLDVATNSWIEGPRMTTPRQYLGLAVLNGCLWAVGGRTDSVFTSEFLDPITNTWVVAGPSLPAGVQGLYVAVIP